MRKRISQIHDLSSAIRSSLEMEWTFQIAWIVNCVSHLTHYCCHCWCFTHSTESLLSKELCIRFHQADPYPKFVVALKLHTVNYILNFFFFLSWRQRSQAYFCYQLCSNSFTKICLPCYQENRNSSCGEKCTIKKTIQLLRVNSFFVFVMSLSVSF